MGEDKRNLVEGFFHVQIMEDGEVVGDSGKCKNVFTQDGMEWFMENLTSSDTEFITILDGDQGTTDGSVMLGDNSAVGYTDGLLPGEHGVDNPYSDNVSFATAYSLGGDQYTASEYVITATFAAGWNNTTGAVTVGNVGIYTSSFGAGWFLCGNNFTPSTVAINQAVQVTYTISIING